MAKYEFLISQKSRQTYRFDDALFSLNGTLISLNFEVARKFSEQMGKILNRYIPAGDIYAMGVIHEILHYLLRQYEINHLHTIDIFIPTIQDLDNTSLFFLKEFPSLEIYQGKISPEKYLNQITDGITNQKIALEEMLLLHLANENPAYTPYRDPGIRQGFFE